MPQTKAEFIAYLRNTLIPDLRASGSDFTADDFETCLKYMEQEGPALKVSVDPKRLAYLLCSGLEGGIGYWATITGYHKPFRMDFRFDRERTWKHIDYPMNPSGYIEIETESSINEIKVFKLDLPKLKKGLEVMAEKYPRHFARWMEENEDAETGDVFIQCALFGEIVFG